MAIVSVISLFVAGCEDDGVNNPPKSAVENRSSHTVTYTITNHGRQTLAPGEKAIYDNEGEGNLTVTLIGPSSVTAEWKNFWLVIFVDL